MALMKEIGPDGYYHTKFVRESLTPKKTNKKQLKEEAVKPELGKKFTNGMPVRSVDGYLIDFTRVNIKPLKLSITTPANKK